MSDWFPYSFMIEEIIPDEDGSNSNRRRLIVFWEREPDDGKMVDDIIQHVRSGFKPFCKKIVMRRTVLSGEEFDRLWKIAEDDLKERKKPVVEPEIETSENTVFVVQYNDSKYPGWKDSKANDIASHDAVKIHLKAYKKTYKKIHGDRFTFRIIKRHMQITDEVVS